MDSDVEMDFSLDLRRHGNHHPSKTRISTQNSATTTPLSDAQLLANIENIDDHNMPTVPPNVDSTINKDILDVEELPLDPSVNSNSTDPTKQNEDATKINES